MPTERASPSHPRIAGAIAMGFAVGLSIFVLAFALAWASLAVDGNSVRAAVRAGFTDGSLRPDADWLLNNVDVGAHQHNDCLVLYQAAAQGATRLQQAVSPLSLPEDGIGRCEHLADLAANKPGGPDIFYHHYIHLQTTLARLLIPRLGVAGTRGLYRLIASILLLAALATAMAGLVRGARPSANGAFIVVSLVFMRWFGLESFGQSLGHAPADAVALAFLLFLVHVAGDQPLARRTALISAAVFGGFTAAFELLTGGLPLGLAMVMGLLPIAMTGDPRQLPTTLEASLANVAAAAASFVAKFTVAAIVFDSTALTESMGKLLFRAGIGHAAADEPHGWDVFAARIWAGIDALAPGMQYLVLGVLLLAVVAGGWSYGVLRRHGSPTERDRANALAGSNVIILLWFIVFWEHSIVHAWFMDRLFVWPIASGFALFLLAVLSASARRAQRQIGQPSDLAPAAHHRVED